MFKLEKGITRYCKLQSAKQKKTSPEQKNSGKSGHFETKPQRQAAEHIT